MAICECLASRTDAVDGEVRGRSWHLLPFDATVGGNQCPFGYVTTPHHQRANLPDGQANTRTHNISTCACDLKLSQVLDTLGNSQSFRESP
jgi:hypothetical protein